MATAAAIIHAAPRVTLVIDPDGTVALGEPGGRGPGGRAGRPS